MLQGARFSRFSKLCTALTGTIAKATHVIPLIICSTSDDAVDLCKGGKREKVERLRFLEGTDVMCDL